MKTSMHLSSALASLLLVGALCLPANGLRAETYTLTTASADGGFDGWINANNQSDSTGTLLRVGNTETSSAYFRTATLLMFDLSKLSIDFNTEQIVSVSLSYYVSSVLGSGTLTVTHGTKTAEALEYGASKDTPLTSVTNETWTDNLGNVVAPGSKSTVSLDVTAAFLSDLGANNAYSSYRLVQPDTYTTVANGGKMDVSQWGSIVASAQNTSGYLIPTLTIVTQAIPIPEPAYAGMIAGSALLFLAFLVRRRRR